MIFPLAARMENRPSRPVTVPVGLPLKETLTPIKGSPLSSFTIPDSFLLSTSTFDCGIIMIYLSLIL